MSHVSRTVGTIILVVALHIPAVWGSWYFFFWWYDVLMHGLGGFAVGCAAMVLWGVQKSSSWKSYGRYILFVLGCTALVGIGWEWLEGLVDALFLTQGTMAPAQLGLVDTMLDLYFDLLGGLLAFFIAQRIDQKKEGVL